MRVAIGHLSFFHQPGPDQGDILSATEDTHKTNTRQFIRR